MGTMRPCTACGAVREREHLTAAAGPGGTSWYCNPFCPPKENPMTLPQHSRFASWTPAENTEGDQYKPREHYGNSCIIRIVEYKESVVTSNSPNGAPAVIVDVHDLNMKQTFRDVLMMTGAIVDTFKPLLGGPPIVVRWEKTIAKNGRDYAKPVPATPEAMAAAENVYATGDPFAPTLGTITAEEPF